MRSEEWLQFRNFSSYEFDSPDEPGSGNKMQISTIKMLQQARDIVDVYGITFHINSGFRTKIHNKRLGGTENSSHLGGWAVDIKIRNNHERVLIVHALMEAGFQRIGIHENFVHVDNDPMKNSSMWLYPTTNANILTRFFLTNKPEDW